MGRFFVMDNLKKRSGERYESGGTGKRSALWQRGAIGASTLGYGVGDLGKEWVLSKKSEARGKMVLLEGDGGFEVKMVIRGEVW